MHGVQYKVRNYSDAYFFQKEKYFNSDLACDIMSECNVRHCMSHDKPI